MPFGHLEVYMRKKRLLLDNIMYHVTSRTNGKEKIFNHKPGKVIMMSILKEAKERFYFTVANFCVMPTHIHLLITPNKGADLPKIMLWIKTNFTKRWNRFYGKSGHIAPAKTAKAVLHIALTGNCLGLHCAEFLFNAA